MYSQCKPSFDLMTFLLKLLVAVLFLVVFSCLYFLLTAIINSSLVSICIILYLLYKLLRTIGLLIMYPGSFSYYKGSIEASYSGAWKKRMKAIIRILKGIQREVFDIQQVDSCIVSLEYFKNAIEKYDNKITKRKKQLVNCLEGIINSSKDIIQLKVANIGNKFQASEIINHLKHHLQHLEIVLDLYNSPKGMINQIQHNISQQKLYKLSYGFGLYDTSYHYERKKFNKIELLIFQGFKARHKNETKDIVLFCNPNGAYIQQFAIQCKHTNFYLSLGLNVCLWNYRGYSGSKGDPSISAHQKDVLLIYDALIKWGYNPTIVHGYSIGGPIAIYLASQRKVDLLVADRTFSSLYQMSKQYGKILSILNCIVFWKDQSDYAKMFYQLKCTKIIINDPYDQVILNGASLKTGIARLCFREIKGNTSQYNQKEKEKEMIQLQNVTLESSQLNLNSPLVRLLVTQENKQYGLLDKKFTQALITNTMPFADSYRHGESYYPKVQSLQTIIHKFKKSFSNVSKFDYKSIHEIEEASSTSKSSFLKVSFPNSCYFHMTTLDKSYIQKLQEQQIISSMESFIEGLVVYGSLWFNYSDCFLRPIANRTNTILTLHQLFDGLEEACIEVEQDTYAINLIQNLKQQVAFLGNFIYQNLTHPAYSKVGILIPTDTGHNGDLRDRQISAIASIIRSEVILRYS